MDYVFKPRGVCSQQIMVSTDGETITNCQVLGGCDGNLKGITALVKGRSIEEIANALEGITCDKRKTSCPDQISKALRQILQPQGNAACGQ